MVIVHIGQKVIFTKYSFDVHAIFYRIRLCFALGQFKCYEVIRKMFAYKVHDK